MAKGQKTCPLCKTTTGPRAFKCANESCPHEYTITKKKETITAEVTKERLDKSLLGAADGNFTLIYAPGAPNKNSAYCPFKPASDSKEDVIKWIENLKNFETYTCGNKTKYARTAIKYFVDYYWPMYITVIDEDRNKHSVKNPKYQEVIDLIDTVVQPYQREILQGYA